MLYKSLVTMDPFKTNLASLHYVTFIEPFVVMPTESLSFSSEQFMNNSITKLIEEKTNDPFILLEEHFFIAFLLQKKYEVQFEDLTHEVLEFFSEP
jgi:hypothetical protein